MKNVKSKMIKWISVLILWSCSFFIIGCETTLLPRVTKIEIIDDVLKSEIVLGDFELEEIKLRVYYDSNTAKIINLTKDMLTTEDVNKLTQLGKHEITVNYENHQVMFVITLITEQIEIKEKMNLSILEINDLHGYVEQDESQGGGIANIAYLVNEIRNEDPSDDVVLMGNGDLFQGTAISNLYDGLSVIEMMNAMDFDAMGIGNHEFDWGLPTILQYFDGDLDNGEANFPLLNANIYQRSNNQLVSIEGGKIFESTIIEREGIKIGLVSYIGDVSSSINYAMYQYYEIDTDIASSAFEICKGLKDLGTDVIVINIHGGNSSSVRNYQVNNDLALLQYQDEYLVDAIINGHTHTAQSGYISRSNGVSVPVVQAGGYNSHLGRINLEFDFLKKDVISTTIEVIDVETAGNKFDHNVQSIVDKYANEINNEVYCVAGEDVHYSSELRTWAGNVLRSATGADIAIGNNGGLRSNGNIVTGGNIGINNIYSICPFNNQIVMIRLTGDEIYQFIRNNEVYFSLIEGESFYQLENSNKEYLVSVIDYVYYWESFPKNETVVFTQYGYTDLLIIDARLHDIFNPISEPNALINNLFEEK